MTEPTRDALHAETLAMLAHDEKVIRDVLDDGILDAPEVLSSRRQLELPAPATECVKRVPELEAEVARLRELLGELVDTSDCRYDHHGYCQAHKLDPRPCPNERAITLLAAYAAATREGADA